MTEDPRRRMKPSKRVADAIQADLDAKLDELEPAHKLLIELSERGPETYEEKRIAMIACYLCVGMLAVRGHRRGGDGPAPPSGPRIIVPR